MKKSVILLILIILTFALFCPTAFGAEEEYYKITDSSTVLKQNSRATPDLFYVPQDCYVKYLGEQDNYYRVEYYGVVGLIEKDKITDKTKYSNLSQYYHTKIELSATDNYYLVDAPGNRSDNNVEILVGDSLTLIGTFNIDSQTFIYVSVVKDGVTKFGAIPSSYTNWDSSVKFIPPNNDTSSDFKPLPGGVTVGGGESEETTQEPTNNLVRVILIIGICVPAFLIIYLIFKPVKPNSDRYNEPKRREIDYEDFE